MSGTESIFTSTNSFKKPGFKDYFTDYNPLKLKSKKEKNQKEKVLKNFVH